MAGRESDDLWMDNEEKLLSTNLGEIQNAFRRYRHIIQTTQQELKERQQELQERQQELQERQDEVRDLKNRLSVMASERMSAHNPCVEDLSDPLRPTALAASWESLFRSGAYWAAYEALSTGSGKEDAGQLLYSVTKTVYDRCARTVQDVLTAVASFSANALLENGELKSSVTGLLEWKWETRKKVDVLFPNDNTFCADLRSCISDACRKGLLGESKTHASLSRSTALQFLKSRGPPESLKKKVDDALRGMLPTHTPEVLGFVSELQRLCFFMRVQDIPLAVDLSHDVGSAFDPHLFDLESSVAGNATGAAIRCILRPPLLRFRDGPVLVRGEAEVQAATDQGVSPTPAPQAAATQADRAEVTEAPRDRPPLQGRQSTRDREAGSHGVSCSTGARRNPAQQNAGVERQPMPQTGGRPQGSNLSSVTEGAPQGSQQSPPKKQDASNPPDVKMVTVQMNAEDGGRPPLEKYRTEGGAKDTGGTEKRNQNDELSNLEMVVESEEVIELSEVEKQHYISTVQIQIQPKK